MAVIIALIFLGVIISGIKELFFSSPEVKTHTQNKPKENKELTIEEKNISVLTKKNDNLFGINKSEYLYKEVVERKGYLIHVTERKNLAGILECKNILSLQNLKKNDIKPAFMTDEISRNLDHRKGFDEYVHLAFDESYPMFSAKLYYLQLNDPAIIKIDPKIITDHEKDILLSDTNSSASLAKTGSINELLSSLDFQIIYFPKDQITNTKIYQNLKKKKQSEILVKEKIPLEYVKEIYVSTAKGLNITDNMKITETDTCKKLRLNF